MVWVPAVSAIRPVILARRGMSFQLAPIKVITDGPVNRKPRPVRIE